MSTSSSDDLPLAGRRIVLGVTGGIAAYKAIEVCRRLIDAGAHVIPILTEAAMHMVGETTFAALASEPPRRSLWSDAHPIPHTHLGQTADAVVVCPATARIISDLRIGRSADLLAATLLATEAPVIVCPAMHTEMWEHPAVQDNLDVLRSRGVVVVPPETGRLAGGDVGTGRLADPLVVVETVIGQIGWAAGRLADRFVIVTAGGTREPIDPVRYLGNRSSGKQGHAIAAAARRAGAEVRLITTSTLPSAPGVDRTDVTTAEEMHAAVLDVAAAADVIVMAAAVADFAPADVSVHKIKKDGGPPEITLVPTADILADLGDRKAAGTIRALLVGFAAETEQVAEHARAKLKNKHADFIVANDVSAAGVGFAHDTNAVTIYGNGGIEVGLSLRSKAQVASRLCDLLADHLPSTESMP